MKHIITINGKEHILTDDEARSLYAELDSLFGAAPAHPYHPPAPIRFERDAEWAWKLPIITCADK